MEELLLNQETNVDLHPIDSVIQVMITEDRLKAFLMIYPPENGGHPPTLEAMEERLTLQRVTYGIHAEKLKELADNPQYNQKILIAEGMPPKNGTDGSAVFQFSVEKEYKPKVNSDGTVDFLDLNYVENVEKGQCLCLITLPTGGTEGLAVTGQKLTPIKGKPVPSFLGHNTLLSSDGTQILSKVDGQVEFIRGKINVNETFTLRGDVNLSTGNLKVNGNIVVCGTVLPGFTVEAGGSIEVKGPVESATLKAGANIKLYSGITGSKMECLGDLCSRFIENCTVFVRGNVKSEYIMDSDIKCGKNLEIIGNYAKFLGGSCIVGQNMSTRVIGSSSGVPTKLELGTDLSTVLRRQEIIKEIPLLQKQLHSLAQLISMLHQLEEAGKLNNERKKLLEEAPENYDGVKAQIDALNLELAQIEEQLKENRSGKLTCTGAIYPGTSIKIKNASLAVTDTMTNVTLTNQDGVICKTSAV